MADTYDETRLDFLREREPDADCRGCNETYRRWQLRNGYCPNCNEALTERDRPVTVADGDAPILGKEFISAQKERDRLVSEHRFTEKHVQWRRILIGGQYRLAEEWVSLTNGCWECAVLAGYLMYALGSVHFPAPAIPRGFEEGDQLARQRT